MTTVNVNLSQSAWTTITSLRAQSGASTLAESVNIFFVAGHMFSATHPYFSSASLVGSTGRLNFSDGGYELYTGVVDLTPASNNGKAIATAIEEFAPDAFRLAFA